ncbi:MAG: YggS family pyridoxal phosphate-dependent enzyme [Chloroflexi bacterium]|nr:YggS family pyridoxal phosphate-dependent enzyme [Chloroflexota bacterium]
MKTLSERYDVVLDRIHHTAVRANRNPAEITLVAVTKTLPAEIVQAAYEVGMRHFGENRAAELVEKRPLLTSHTKPDDPIIWHAIGTIQSRKTNAIANHADIFHALDRLKIANRLSHRLVENGRNLPIFLEINISGEASKAGFNCAHWEQDATQTAHLRTVAQKVAQLPSLQLAGLMTMAPWHVEPEQIRTIFRRTRQLAQQLQNDLALTSPLQLSMGMTDDFEIAIEEGATHIRVGRAIFGER